MIRKTLKEQIVLKRGQKKRPCQDKDAKFI